MELMCRCKAIDRKTGEQCTEPAGDDGYCRKHANRLIPSRRTLYRLRDAAFSKRVQRFAMDPKLKSLHAEIGMTRALIEKMLNSDLPMQVVQNEIKGLNSVLDKLIRTTDAMDERAGITISRALLVQVAQEIAKAVATRLEGLPDYEEVIDLLIQDIKQVVLDAGKNL